MELQLPYREDLLQFLLGRILGQHALKTSLVNRRFVIDMVIYSSPTKSFASNFSSSPWKTINGSIEAMSITLAYDSWIGLLIPGMVCLPWRAWMAASASFLLANTAKQHPVKHNKVCKIQSQTCKLHHPLKGKGRGKKRREKKAWFSLKEIKCQHQKFSIPE